MAPDNLRTTPLAGRHREAGARMVDFAGWLMPVQYAGIIHEHLHTRKAAGLFDTSHMGELWLEGPTARADLERLMTCRIEDLEPGRARYGLLLEQGGGILDDLIAYCVAQDRFLLVVNASNTEKDRGWIECRLSAETVLTDAGGETAMLSLQGPLSREVLAPLVPADLDLASLRRFRVAEATVTGAPAIIARTGYTGELGYELFVPRDAAVGLWDALVEHPRVEPVGLGARDTLRLEKGLPLYGNDLDQTRTPVEAGLERFVAMDTEFIGREALEKKGEPARVLTGFVCEGRRSARSHDGILADGRDAGEVTSGAFSPSMGRAIGLGYIERSAAQDGRGIRIDHRGVEIGATVKTPPMVE